MPITICYSHSHEDEQLTMKDRHDTAVRIDRNKDADVLLFDENDRIVALYPPYRFVSALIDQPEPDGKPGSDHETQPWTADADKDTDAAEPTTSFEINSVDSVTSGHLRFYGSGEAIKINEPLNTRETQLRRLAERILAAPDAAGYYPGEHLLRAYEQGLVDGHRRVQ